MAVSGAANKKEVFSIPVSGLEIFEKKISSSIILCFGYPLFNTIFFTTDEIHAIIKLLND